MFDIPLHLTSNIVLAQIPEELIFEKYLGIKVTNNLISSPFKKDLTPSAKFYKIAGRIVLIDFSGDFKGDCIRAVMYLFSISHQEALLKILEDFKDVEIAPIISPIELDFLDTKLQQEAPSKSKIRVKILPWTTKNYQYWKDYAISVATLIKYNVFPISHVWLQDNPLPSFVKDGMYAYYFGQEQFKIYLTRNSTIRFISNTDYLQGYRQLPQTGDLLVITKSLKDVMVLYELGITALAPQSESILINSEILTQLEKRFTRIIINYDWDRAGCRTMQKYKKLYNFTCISLKKPLSSKTHIKDISDYIKIHGKAATLEFIKTINK